MSVVLTLISKLNETANVLGSIFIYPIDIMPGWLSITLFSAIIGIVLLVIYKYTSNQSAIAAIRNDIKANLLAVKLYKGNLSLAITAQGNIMLASLKLLIHSLVPMAVMIVPVSLVLAQLGLWYQAKPAAINDQPVIIKMKLNGRLSSWPDITLEPNAGIKDLTGPVRVDSRKEVFWKTQPMTEGQHVLRFQVGDQIAEKRLAVGDGFMRISTKRPGQKLSDMLLNPMEQAFDKHAAVESIEIHYPDRQSHVYGTDWWLIYLFAVSMVFALVFKPFLKVRI